MGQDQSMPRKSGAVKPTSKGKSKPGKPVKRLEAYDTKSVDVKVTLAKMGIETVQLDGKTTYAELVEVVKEENHATTNDALEEIILEKTAPPPEPEDYDDWDEEDEEYEGERAAAPPKRTRKPRTTTSSEVLEVVELDAPSTLVYDTGADDQEEVRAGRGAAVYGPMNRQFAELYDQYEESRVAQIPPVTSTQRTVSTRKNPNKLDPSAIEEETATADVPPPPPMPVSNGGFVPPAPAPPSVPTPTLPRNSVPVPPPPVPVVLPPVPEATVEADDATMEDPFIRQADGNGMEVTPQTTLLKTSPAMANGRLPLAQRQAPMERLQSAETGPVA